MSKTNNNLFDSDDEDYQKGRNKLGLDQVKSYTKKEVGGTIEDEVAQYEQEIEKYMQMSLDSTQRSCQQLESSDKIAESTARDLLEQREKLERVENNLEEIHQTSQHTQRSLNSLKSLFGGLIRNKFSRAPKEKSRDRDETQPPVEQNSMNTSKSADQLGKLISQQSGNSDQNRGGTSATRSLIASSQAYIQGTRWEAMDNQIDDNLDQMSSQLGRLRTWGTALGDEVDDQNRMLERIHQKADRNDTVIRKQEGQMRKLLG